MNKTPCVFPFDHGNSCSMTLKSWSFALAYSGLGEGGAQASSCSHHQEQAFSYRLPHCLRALTDCSALESQIPTPHVKFFTCPLSQGWGAHTRAVPSLLEENQSFHCCSTCSFLLLGDPTRAPPVVPLWLPMSSLYPIHTVQWF